MHEIIFIESVLLGHHIFIKSLSWNKCSCKPFFIW